MKYKIYLSLIYDYFDLLEKINCLNIPTIVEVATVITVQDHRSRDILIHQTWKDSEKMPKRTVHTMASNIFCCTQDMKMTTT